MEWLGLRQARAPPKDTRSHSIVVVGDANSGKTSLLLSALGLNAKAEIPLKLDPLVRDECGGDVDAPGLEGPFAVHDTHGEVDDALLVGASVVVVCVDATSPDRTPTALRWLSHIAGVRGRPRGKGNNTTAPPPLLPVVVCHTKVDLCDAGCQLSSLQVPLASVPAGLWVWSAVVSSTGQNEAACTSSRRALFEAIRLSFFPPSPLVEPLTFSVSARGRAAFRFVFRAIAEPHAEARQATSVSPTALLSAYPTCFHDLIAEVEGLARQALAADVGGGQFFTESGEYTEVGFVEVHNVFLTQSRYRATVVLHAVWSLLQCHGFSWELRPSSSALPFCLQDPANPQPDYELTPDALRRLLALFEQHAQPVAAGGAPQGRMLELAGYHRLLGDMGEVPPVLQHPQHHVEVGAESGGLSAGAFQRLWHLSLHTHPETTVRALGWLVKDAGEVVALRGRSAMRHRKVFKCLVTGAHRGGKTTVVTWALQDGQQLAKPCVAVQVDDAVLVVEECSLGGSALAAAASVADCVVVCFNGLDTHSMQEAFELSEQSLTHCPTVLVSTHMDKGDPKDVAASHAFCDQHRILHPLLVSPSHDMQDLWARVAMVCRNPDTSRLQRWWQRREWRLGGLLVGLGFGVVGMLALHRWLGLARSAPSTPRHSFSMRRNLL